jgi:prepilin-type N-terminal cleavage/methylation domain-containing protein/prepilin-type processing-associated H-X9-DG protein
MKTHWRRRNADRGFTLVELLVVIMIIAILAGLLFPVITATVENAQSLECRNNLKEIAQAVLRYASENGGVIVPAYDEEAGLRWANILVMRGYVTSANIAGQSDDPLEKRSILLCPSTLSVENTTTAPLSPFADEAQGWVRLGNDTHEVACSYYWNGCTDTDPTLTYRREFPSLLIPQDETNKRQFLHYLTEIRQQTSFVMAMDGIFMDAQLPANRGRIAARHRGEYGRRSRTNVVFYDGHVEEYQWKQDYETTDPLWTTQNPDMKTVANSLSGGSLIFRLDDQVYTPPAE